MRWYRPVMFGCVVALVLLAARPGFSQVTIFFDGSGPENGVTEPGTTIFSLLGSSWSGGIVRTERMPPLYASGSFSYEIRSEGGEVAFDPPADSVRFFYVHGFGFTAGTATAFDAANSVVGTANSRPATSSSDPTNFVALDPPAPIARIEFSAGVIDNFTFTGAAADPATATPTHTPPARTSTPTPPPTDTPSIAVSPTPTRTAGPRACVGDCNGDTRVTVEELVRGVHIALARSDLGECAAFDANLDARVTIDELIAAVDSALRGCA